MHANRRRRSARPRACKPDGGTLRRAEGELVIEQVTSREAADRWHQIAQEQFEADYYEMPADPVQEIYERVESTRSDDRYELWLGYLRADTGGAGMPVVLGEIRLPLLDNVENAVVNVATRPAYRRHGYGTAMLDHLITRARANDRTRLIGDICEPMPISEHRRRPRPQPPPGVLFSRRKPALGR